MIKIVFFFNYVNNFTNIMSYVRDKILDLQDQIYKLKDTIKNLKRKYQDVCESESCKKKKFNTPLEEIENNLIIVLKHYNKCFLETSTNALCALDKVFDIFNIRKDKSLQRRKELFLEKINKFKNENTLEKLLELWLSSEFSLQFLIEYCIEMKNWVTYIQKNVPLKLKLLPNRNFIKYINKNTIHKYTNIYEHLISYLNKNTQINKELLEVKNILDNLNNSNISEKQLEVNPNLIKFVELSFYDEKYKILLDDYNGKISASYNVIKNSIIQSTDKNLKTLDDFIHFNENGCYNFNKFKLDRIQKSLQELNLLVGMNEVKNKIIKMIKHVLLDINSLDTKYHTIITGDPGVGKTTLAKILGKIYNNLDLIKSSNEYKFTQVKRSDLIGEYVGQTAPKTLKVLEEAKGGVLFIDEAYSLGSTTTNCFSKEALDVINQFMEDHKDEIIIMLGGYKEPIQRKVLDTNEGFARRFTYIFNLDNYNGDELFQILKKQLICKKPFWSLSSEDEIKSHLNKNQKMIKYGGGSIENLIAAMKLNYADRIFGSNSSVDLQFSFQDFINAFDNITKLEDKNKEEELPLPNMYI